MKRRNVLFWVFILVAQYVSAQIITPTSWKFETNKASVKVGDEIELIFKVSIIDHWHFYSNDFELEIGPTPAKFNFKKDPAYQLVGKTIPVKPQEVYDEVFEGKVRFFDHIGEFRQKVKILAPLQSITGSYDGQACTDAGKCVQVDGDFSFPIQIKEAAIPSGSTLPSAPKPQTVEGLGDSHEKENAILNPETEDSLYAKSIADSIIQSVADTMAKSEVNQSARVVAADPSSESLWGFFLAAFLSGLVALLTPCVFPMIPMTVTFFTRQSKSRTEGIGKAIAYGLSIIILYVLIGTLVSRINGPEFANFVSTHWIPNLFFFLVFLFFGFSFLGAFEIVLPSSWVNAADRQSDKGGIYGIFFMAFTIVLVSFSCTGPIVGSILVQSAGGQVLKPIIGMFGYSLAFALPFTLFAIFPQWLSNLPKSGGWLNSVKVVLGFIELAFALKFFSVADQAYHWRLLDREVYLAAWIVIFTLIGFYLLGKIRLPHDSPMEKLSVSRVALSIVVFSFVVYMIPGLWGAPLKKLSGYLPPETSQDFYLRTGSHVPELSAHSSSLCDTPKYADFLHLPHNLQGYFDMNQALACAKQQNKPVFVDFTGHGCVNCREMEASVWSDPEVLKRLQKDYVVVAIYVDDKTELPEKDWYVSKTDGREKKTIGKQNADLQVSRYGSNSQPLYVLLSPEGELLAQPRAYDLDVQAFVKFLDEGKSRMSSLITSDRSLSIN